MRTYQFIVAKNKQKSFSKLLNNIQVHEKELFERGDYLIYTMLLSNHESKKILDRQQKKFL